MNRLKAWLTSTRPPGETLVIILITAWAALAVALLLALAVGYFDQVPGVGGVTF